MGASGSGWFVLGSSGDRQTSRRRRHSTTHLVSCCLCPAGSAPRSLTPSARNRRRGLLMGTVSGASVTGAAGIRHAVYTPKSVWVGATVLWPPHPSFPWPTSTASLPTRWRVWTTGPLSPGLPSSPRTSPSSCPCPGCGRGDAGVRLALLGLPQYTTVYSHKHRHPPRQLSLSAHAVQCTVLRPSAPMSYVRGVAVFMRINGTSFAAKKRGENSLLL